MSQLDAVQLVIGDTPQYFFDDGLIEEVQHVTRRMHRPVSVEGSPFIQRDRPWEHVPYFSSVDWSIWRDRETGRFHCTYTDLNVDRERLAREGGAFIDWANGRLRVCYAYSDDGFEWVKPPLGMVNEHGHDTNIVLGSETYGSAWGLSVFKDPLEHDPNRRYKGFHVMVPPGYAVASDEPGAHVRVGYSPDGIHWTVTDERPTVGRSGTRIGDSAQPAFDPGTETYLLFTRHPWMSLAPRSRPLHATELGGHPTWDAAAGAPNRRGRRRIYLSESRDYLHWSEPRLILAPDSLLDNIDDSFYSMSAMWLGGQWIGFIQVFHMVENTLDVQLVHSRDGRIWHRLFPGQAWLPLGPAGSWNQCYTSLPRFPDVDGKEWLVFHGGSRAHHDWWIHGRQEGLDAPEVWDLNRVAFGLGMTKLRKYGFVSLDADRMREGMILTQPWVAPGDRLVINAACGPEGYVKVEALDIHDRVLPGCSRDDCDVFTGDAIEHTMTWRGDSHLPIDVPSLGGEVYTHRLPHRRLRFILRDAQLYSFRIEASTGTA